MRSAEEQPIAGPSKISNLIGDAQAGEPERAAKRRRTGQVASDRAGTDTPEWASDGDEEIDQLISDTEPTVLSIPTMVPLDSQIYNGAPANEPTSTNTPVSSPSLAKILHITNVEPQKGSPSPIPAASAAKKPLAAQTPPKPEPEAEPLSEYTCPICFFPPTNATVTPCGHICCGSCLFTAVRTTMQRGTIMMAEGNVARYAR
jgi:hypothetical protein